MRTGISTAKGGSALEQEVRSDPGQSTSQPMRCRPYFAVKADLYRRLSVCGSIGAPRVPKSKLAALHQTPPDSSVAASVSPAPSASTAPVPALNVPAPSSIPNGGTSTSTHIVDPRLTVGKNGLADGPNKKTKPPIEKKAAVEVPLLVPPKPKSEPRANSVPSAAPAPVAASATSPRKRAVRPARDPSLPELPPRGVQACETCRARKIRCGGMGHKGEKCGYCAKIGANCELSSVEAKDRAAASRKSVFWSSSAECVITSRAHFCGIEH